MDKVWRNFLIAIVSVLVLLLAFCVIYEELSKEENKEKGLRRKGGPGREAGPSKRQPEKEKTVYEKDVRRILEGGAKRSPYRKWIWKARGGVKGR